jgi:hypothetical protein
MIEARLMVAQQQTGTQGVVMSAPPVVIAPPAPAPKETGLQKFESVIDHIATGIEKFNNALVNVGEAELPALEPFLPPNLGAMLGKFLPAAATELASADAQFAAIGQANAPWGVKAAKVAAVSGVGLLSILAEFGYTVGSAQLPALLALVPGILGAINLQTVTAPPVPPAAAPAAPAAIPVI